MAKEKFELLFLAGGALLDVFQNTLRRAPATPREEVGAAAHAVGALLDDRGDTLPDGESVRSQVAAIREELTAERPDPLVLAAYVDELAALVSGDAELADAVERLSTAIAGFAG